MLLSYCEYKLHFSDQFGIPFGAEYSIKCIYRRLCHFWPLLSNKPVPSQGTRKSYKLFFSRNFVLLLKTISQTFGSVTTNASRVPIHILYIEPYSSVAFSKYDITSERIKCNWGWLSHLKHQITSTDLVVFFFWKSKYFQKSAPRSDP